MKLKIIELNTFLIIVISLTELQAQEVVHTAGSSIMNSKGSISFSIGQMVYTNNTGMNGSVAPGVQQAYEISIVSEIEMANKINLSICAYPNPTIDFLTLSIDNFEISDLSYNLYDNAGKHLRTEKVETNQTNISTASLASATYFLVVTQKSHKIKTFKIIKD